MSTCIAHALINMIGGMWSEEALDQLDNLTHCACWKPVMVRVIHPTINSVLIVDTSTDQVCSMTLL